MFRKHTRRAAKAAFAISTGVALLVGWDSRPRRGRAPRRTPTVTIGTKNFTEQYVLGQLYKQALEAKGYKVVYKENIGSSELIDTALTSGQDQLLPGVHGRHRRRPREADGAEDRSARMRRRRSSRRGRATRCFKTTPFYDSDSFGMLTSTAKKLGVKTIADMKKVKSFSYAGYPECRDAHHLPARAEADLRPDADEVRPARVDQRLHAARPGQDHGGRRVLDRSAALQREVHDPDGHEAHLRLPERRARVSKKLASAGGAKFAATVNAVSAKLSIEAMIAMNKAVAIDKKSPEDVASAFLTANKLK